MDVKYSGDQVKKYTDFANNSFSWKFIEKPVIKKHLNSFVDSNTRILDAGCGTGRLFPLLLSLGAKSENIIGVDNSPDALQVAHKNYPEIELIESNLLDLELGKNDFNLIVSNMVFHYFNQQDYRKIIRKFAGNLRIGGLLLFVTVHPLRFISNHSEYFNDCPKIEQTPWGTEIEYYPKKVSDYINAILYNGFQLQVFEEPYPNGKEARKHKDDFEKYTSNPTRIVVKAVKEK